MCVPIAQLYDKIAPGAPHALHMPSHIYSILGMWEDSVRSNLAAKAAADDYAAKNFPDATHPGVPHMLDFMVTAYLQTAKDGDAKKLVDSLSNIKKFPFVTSPADRHGLSRHSGAFCARPRPLGRGRAAACPRQPVSGGPNRSPTSPARSAPPVQGIRRQPVPRSPISTRSKQGTPLPRTHRQLIGILQELARLSPTR
jgi:hypothetical protein